MLFIRKKREVNVWKGLAAGLVAGLVSSYAMNGFQALWSKLSENGNDSEDQKSSKREAKSEGAKNKGAKSEEESEDATVKTASAISENVFDHRLTKSEKKVAGPAVHYSFGTAMGGFYGAMAEFVPAFTTGAGAPFGAAVWAAADEVALPALGLTKSPTEYPISNHAYALASHIVYGVTTDAVRRLVRRAL